MRTQCAQWWAVLAMVNIVRMVNSVGNGGQCAHCSHMYAGVCICMQCGCAPRIDDAHEGPWLLKGFPKGSWASLDGCTNHYHPPVPHERFRPAHDSRYGVPLFCCFLLIISSYHANPRDTPMNRGTIPQHAHIVHDCTQCVHVDTVHMCTGEQCARVPVRVRSAGMGFLVWAVGVNS